jgi:hypothetical protein
MQPIEVILVRERIAALCEEANRERIARAGRTPTSMRIRQALGHGLVALGERLAGAGPPEIRQSSRRRRSASATR